MLAHRKVCNISLGLSIWRLRTRTKHHRLTVLLVVFDSFYFCHAPCYLQCKVRMWYMQCLEKLWQLQLYSAATDIIKHCGDPYIAQMHAQNTT